MVAAVKSADLLKGTALQPQQARVAANVAAQRENDGQSRLLVYHGLGSGKSLSALKAVEALGGPATAIVPASLRPNFAKERKKFVDPATGQPLAIMSQTALARGMEPENTDTLVVDEAQRFRNSGSAQTKALLDAADNARNVLLLSGTPVVNGPGDFAPLHSILTGNRMTGDEFEARYTTEGSHPGMLARLFGAKDTGPGLANEDELRRSLAGKIDYYKDRKPGARVRKVDVETEVSDDQDAAIGRMLARVPDQLLSSAIAGKLSGKDMTRFAAFLTGPREASLSLAPFTGQAPVEAFDGSPKLMTAMKNLHKVLDANPKAKALVFSNYIDAGINPYAAALQRDGIPSGAFTGKLSDANRKKLVDDYNNDRIRVALLGPSGTEGLSFKGTRLIQRLDPHWNLARGEQSDGRGLRFDSHIDLPEADREVRVERYIAKAKQRNPGFFGRLLGKTPYRGFSADEYIRDAADRKAEMTNKFLALLQEIGTPKKASVGELVNTVVDAGRDAYNAVGGAAESVGGVFERHPRLTILGGLATGIVGSIIANRRHHSSLRGTARINDKRLPALLAAAKLPAGLPVVKLQGLDNAYYAPPGMGEIEFEDVKKRRADAQHGHVAYDPNFGRAGIIAHELGHASIQARGGLSKVNQSIFRPVSDMATIVTPLAGALGGYLLGRGRPLASTVIGGLGGLAIAAPTLVNEWQASQRGLDFMRDAKFKEKDVNAAGKTLRRAGFTYALHPALATAAAAGLGGLAGYIHKKAYATPPAPDLPSPASSGSPAIPDKPAGPQPPVPFKPIGGQRRSMLAAGGAAAGAADAATVASVPATPAPKPSSVAARPTPAPAPSPPAAQPQARAGSRPLYRLAGATLAAPIASLGSLGDPEAGRQFMGMLGGGQPHPRTMPIDVNTFDGQPQPRTMPTSFWDGPPQPQAAVDPRNYREQYVDWKNRQTGFGTIAPAIAESAENALATRGLQAAGMGNSALFGNVGKIGPGWVGRRLGGAARFGGSAVAGPMAAVNAGMDGLDVFGLNPFTDRFGKGLKSQAEGLDYADGLTNGRSAAGLLFQASQNPLSSLHALGSAAADAGDRRRTAIQSTADTAAKVNQAPAGQGVVANPQNRSSLQAAPQASALGLSSDVRDDQLSDALARLDYNRQKATYLDAQQQTANRNVWAPYQATYDAWLRSGRPEGVYTANGKTLTAGQRASMAKAMGL